MPHFHFRLQRTPATTLPLYLRSVGHYTVGAHWRDAVKRKNFVQVFWGIQGTGIIRHNETNHPLPPQSVMVLFPGSIHDISAGDNPWEYRWWTMDGPQAEAVARGFGLNVESPHPAGLCPTGMFESLTRLINSPAPAAERQASALCYELLSLAACTLHAPGDLTATLSQRCFTLMEEQYRNPAFGVTEMAQELGVDRSHLSRTFHEQTGIPPREYLLRLRTQHGIERLQSGRGSIQEVAACSGFASASYFTRVVRKQTGLSPTQILQRALHGHE